MSKTYEDLVYTNFPEEVDTFEYFSDPTANDTQLIKQYQTYFNSGNLTSAAKILVDNPTLRNKIINADNLNKLLDAIKSSQRFYKENIMQYIMNVVVNRGDYSSAIKYEIYNVVYYQDLPYMCISNNTPIGVLPTNKTFWYPLAIVGQQGESGTGLSNRGQWSEYKVYNKDDLVSLNNVLWAATADNIIGETPSSTSAYWDSVLSLNIVLSELKIPNEDIDAIMNGSATSKDDDATTMPEAAESISKDEIDNVLNN